MKPQDYIGQGSAFIAEAIRSQATVPPSRELILLQEYLKVELNRELIESQKKYQDESVKQMRWLVYATWALVIVTLLVVLLKH